MEFIDEHGDRERNIIVKTDQEHSFQNVVKYLIDERREGATVVEGAAVKSSGSNGIVEKGVQDVEVRIRTLCLGLQERLKGRIDARKNSSVYSRERGVFDKSIKYDTHKGTKPSALSIEFGREGILQNKTQEDIAEDTCQVRV